MNTVLHASTPGMRCWLLSRRRLNFRHPDAAGAVSATKELRSGIWLLRPAAAPPREESARRTFYVRERDRPEEAALVNDD